MSLRIYLRCRAAHIFESKYLKNKPKYEKELVGYFQSSFKWWNGVFVAIDIVVFFALFRILQRVILLKMYLEGNKHCRLLSWSFHDFYLSNSTTVVRERPPRLFHGTSSLKIGVNVPCARCWVGIRCRQYQFHIFVVLINKSTG